MREYEGVDGKRVEGERLQEAHDDEKVGRRRLEAQNEVANRLDLDEQRRDEEDEREENGGANVAFVRVERLREVVAPQDDCVSDYVQEAVDGHC